MLKPRSIGAVGEPVVNGVVGVRVATAAAHECLVFACRSSGLVDRGFQMQREAPWHCGHYLIYYGKSEINTIAEVQFYHRPQEEKVLYRHWLVQAKPVLYTFNCCGIALSADHSSDWITRKPLFGPK